MSKPSEQALRMSEGSYVHDEISELAVLGALSPTNKTPQSFLPAAPFHFSSAPVPHCCRRTSGSKTMTAFCWLIPGILMAPCIYQPAPLQPYEPPPRYERHY